MKRSAPITLILTVAMVLGIGTAAAVASTAATQAARDMHRQMQPEEEDPAVAARVGQMVPADMAGMHQGDSTGMAGEAMDGMHAQMRELMPSDMAEPCDEMHAQMVADHDAHHLE